MIAVITLPSPSLPLPDLEPVSRRRRPIAKTRVRLSLENYIQSFSFNLYPSSHDLKAQGLGFLPWGGGVGGQLWKSSETNPPLTPPGARTCFLPELYSEGFWTERGSFLAGPFSLCVCFGGDIVMERRRGRGREWNVRRTGPIEYEREMHIVN